MPLTVLSVSYPLAQVSPRTAGGAEQVLAILDRGLAQAGHRSLVLAPAGSSCKGLLLSAQVPTGNLDERAKRDARRVFKTVLQRALSEYPIDVVHMHGLDFHEYLPDCEIPVIVTLHLPLSWYAPEALQHRKNVKLVCVSKSQAATAQPDVRIDHVIPNGIEVERFYSNRHRANYAVVMSRICPEKGIPLAIDAAERAGCQLTIAGTVFEYREHREYFESMIRPKLGGRIRFIGPIGGDRKAKLLAGARCLLIPSLAPETSSLVAMEAMAASTPVIAFHAGALPEIVDHGRTGFLVNGADEMAEAIAKIGTIFRATCRLECERRFSAKRMMEQYFDLYTSLANRTDVSQLQAA